MRIFTFKTKNKTYYFFSEDDLRKSIKYQKVKNELEREIQTIIKRCDEKFKEMIFKVINRNKSKLKDMDVIDAVKLEDVKAFSKELSDLVLYSYLKGFEIAQRDALHQKIRKKLKFSEEIEILRSKISITKEQLERLSDFFRERYFWLSYITAIDHIEEIKNLLVKTIEEGKTYKDFYDEVNKRFQTRRPYWLETVYRTNIISAFTTAKLRKYKEEFEFLEFHTAIDERTCPVCKKLHNTIRRADDLFWRHFKPPLHYNCRCTILPVYEDKDIKEQFLDINDYEEFFKKKFSNVKDKNLLEITKKFTQTRLFDWEFQFFPDREKAEELFRKLAKKDKRLNIVEIENKIIDKMPYELKDIAIREKYEFKDRKAFRPNEEEKKAIEEYTGSGYLHIREALKTNIEAQRKNIELLQGLFLKYKQNGDLNRPLYRGVKDIPEQEFQRLKRMEIGTILEGFDWTFASTSYNRGIAETFASGNYSVVFEIVKRKTPGIEIARYSRYPNENEVLLPYSFWNKLKIIGKEIKRIGSQQIIYLKVEEV